MRLKKLHYVFSLLTFLFIGLASEGIAQKTASLSTGSATWYGSRYHGRKTSSGEVYNKNKMTAAHNTLPFGTRVKVTNIATGESVVVRINDRGPFGRYGHLIDLSEAAARKIDVGGGTQVRIQVLGTGNSPDLAVTAETETPELLSPEVTVSSTETYFVIQTGSFADQLKAELHSSKIKDFNQDLPIILKEDTVNGKKLHRVVAGKFADRATAEEAKAALEKNGISGLVKQISAGS